MRHVLFAVVLAAGAAVMGTCAGEPVDEGTPDAAGAREETVDDAATGAGSEGDPRSVDPDPGGELVLSGAVDARFSDVGWTLADYDPPPDVEVSGFLLWLYERESGRLENTLTLEGIPYDTPVDTPVDVGPEAGGGQVRGLYVVDAMDPSAGRYVAVSGELTLTEYDSELAGRVDVRMVPADGAGRPVIDGGEPTLTVTGSFRDLPMIEH